METKHLFMVILFPLTILLMSVTLASNKSLTIDKIGELNNLKSRYFLEQGNIALKPQYSHDSKFIYLVTLDGFLKKVNSQSRTVVNEIQLMDSIVSFAISNDDNYIAITNTANQIQLLTTNNFNLFSTIDTNNIKNAYADSVSVINATTRYSFIFTFKSKKEIWEMPYSDKGGVEVFKGWAHDYRKDSGEGKVEDWTLSFSEKNKPPFRRIKTPDYLTDVFFDSEFINIIGRLSSTKAGVVINLDGGRKVSSIPSTLMPNTKNYQTMFQDDRVFISSNYSINNLRNKLHLIDIETGQLLKEIYLPAPLVFTSSHANSPYIWLVLNSKGKKNRISWLNKTTFEIIENIPNTFDENIKQLTFSPQGNFIQISFEQNLPPIIYDTTTFKQY